MLKPEFSMCYGPIQPPFPSFRSSPLRVRRVDFFSSVPELACGAQIYEEVVHVRINAQTEILSDIGRWVS